MKKNTTSLKFITVFTKTLLFTFLFSIIFVGKSLGQTSSFTINYPLTANLTPSISANSNLTSNLYFSNIANNVSSSISSTTITSTVTAGTISFTGITSAASTSITVANSISSLSSNLYKTVSSTKYPSPYIELTITPNANYTLNLNSLTISATSSNAASGVSLAAGYSIDGGNTWSPTTVSKIGGGTTTNTISTSTTTPSTFTGGTSSGALATSTSTTLLFTTDNNINIPKSSSLLLRILIWRYNGNNSGTLSAIGNYNFGISSITGTSTYNPEPSFSTDVSKLSGFYTNTNNASNAQQITLTGSNLTNDVNISANSGNFEISKTSETSGFANTLTVAQSSGTVSQTIYVRVKSGVSAGVLSSSTNLNDKITFTNVTSNGTLSNTVSLSGLVNTNYYNLIGASDLSLGSSWTTDPSGTTSTSSPSGTLTSTNSSLYGNFIISSNATLNNDISLDANSRLTIGDGINNIKLTSNGVIKGNLYLLAISYLNYKSATSSSLIFRSMDPTSTVEYSSSSTQQTAYNTSGLTYNYGNLIISNTSSSGFSMSTNFTVQTSTLIKSGSKFDFATGSTSGYISGTGTFTTEPNSTLAIGSSSGIQSDGTAGNIRNGSSSKNIDKLTKIIYTTTTSGANSVDLGDGFPTEIGDIEINSANKLVSLKKNLYTSGNLKFSGGYGLDTKTYQINLLSTATTDAILTTTLTATSSAVSNVISGTVKTQKYIGNQRGWYIVGLPYGANPGYSTFSNANYSTFANSNNSNIDIDFIKPTLKKYDPVADKWVSLTNDSWTGNTGTAVFVKGIAGEGVNGVYTNNPSNVTFAYIDVTLNIPTSTATPTQNINPNVWNLIINPYPAPITLSKVFSTSSGLSNDTKIAIYDPALSATDPKKKAGGYIGQTGLTFTTDVVIPKMGAFFIKSGSSATINIPSSAITTTINYSNSLTAVTDAPADPGFDPDICSIAAPNVTITNPATICAPSVVNLTAAATVSGSTNVTTYTYWGDASATTQITTPSSISTSGTYYIKGDNAYGCTPSIQPVVVNINPQPVLTGIDNPAVLRASKSITLTLTAPTTTGGTWTISDNTIATINSSTGVVNGIIPGTISVTYSVTNNNGCSNSVTRTIIVQDATKPVISANSSYTFCSGNSIILTSTEQNGNQWYKNGTAITGATSNTYTATTSGDYTIIVNFGTITKTSDPVTLIVNTTPVTPTVSNSSICEGATVNLASATASNTLNWYTLATGGSALTAAPVSSALTAGTYNYYVSNLSADGCESSRASFTVTANAIPAAPTVSNLALCTGTTAAALTTTLTSGNTAKWFTVATGGTALSAAPTPTTTTIGTTNYYVSQISAVGCESTRSTLQVVVNTTPTAPTVTDRALCINSTASALSSVVGTGNITKWYTVATGGTALSATPVPSTTAIGTTDYFATQTTAAGCEGARAKLSVTVASTATPTVQNTNLCNNVTTVALNATKTDNTYTIKWYSAATGGTALTAAPVPSTTTLGTVSYYATQVNPANNCESQRAKIDVITNPIPTAAIISKSQDQKLTASYGTTFQWYKDNTIIPNATSANYYPIENGKYSIMISVNGCNSPMSETFDFISMLDKQDGNTINVGPNPFNNVIQLNYNIPSVRTLTVSVFSIANSTKVYEKANVLPTEQIQLSSLAPGIYIVQIVSDDNRIVEKYKLIKL